MYRAGDAEALPFDWGGGEASAAAEEPRLLFSDPGTRPVKAEEPPPPEPKVDLDGVRKQAFQEGFAAGEESAKEAAERQVAEQAAALGQTVRELAQYKRMLLGEAEREVVDLAFAVARRVIRRELTVDPQAAAGIVRSCLEDVGAAEVRRVRVSPSEAEAVRKAAGPEAEVIADEEIQPGGAVLETSRGRFDARIGTQLDEIQRGLADQ